MNIVNGTIFNLSFLYAVHHMQTRPQGGSTVGWNIN